MINQKYKYKFIKNKHATEVIPIRLIISVIIIFAISSLMINGFFYFNQKLSEDKLYEDLLFLKSELSTMIQSGVYRDINEPLSENGSKRVHVFNIPESINFLSFGDNPTNNNSIEFDSSGIFYKFSNNGIKVIWCNKNWRFTKGKFIDNTWTLSDEFEYFIIKDSYEHQLTFELVKKNDLKYIMIYP